MHGLFILLPDFSLIMLGALLRRTLLEAEAFWGGVEKLVYFVLFPALLFKALATVDIDASVALPMFASGLTVMVAGFAYAWLGRPLMGLDGLGFASRLQCAYRFNTYIGFAIAGKLHGAAGIAMMGAMCGAMVPFANVMAVGVLARHGEVGVLREIVRNPLVLATLSGVLFNLTDIPLSEPVEAFLKRTGDAAVALGLLAVGSALRLRLRSVGGHKLGAAWLILVKLLLVPATAFMIGRQVGLTGIAFDTLVLFAALPAASSAYILAVRMGGDGPGVAWLVSATTLLAVPTLSLWLSLL
jgi:predicted permease